MSSRFAVLGSPIGHSRSPLLHRAAISVLGIDATYDAIEVTEADLSSFVSSLTEEWGGLSLTMPLKAAIRPLLVSECETSRLTGSVNTIVREPDGWHGFNTDVVGAETAIAQSLGTHFRSATILGAGATASSVLVALSRLGISEVTILAREVSRTVPVSDLADRLGLRWTSVALGERSTQSDLVVNTIPGGIELAPEVVDDIDGGALFDVVYDPWPTALAREWSRRGLPTASGLSMLLWQAVRQARAFYGDGVDVQLPNETVVVTAMRSSVGL